MKEVLTDHNTGLIPSTWVLGGSETTQPRLGLCKHLMGARQTQPLLLPVALQCQERQSVGHTL